MSKIELPKFDKKALGDAFERARLIRDRLSIREAVAIVMEKNPGKIILKAVQFDVYFGFGISSVQAIQNGMNNTNVTMELLAVHRENKEISVLESLPSLDNEGVRSVKIEKYLPKEDQLLFKRFWNIEHEDEDCSADNQHIHVDDASDNYLHLFGLTEEQTKIMYSIERLLVLKDAEGDRLQSATKKQWLSSWMVAIEALFKDFEDESIFYLTEEQLSHAVKHEMTVNSNPMWYNLMLLECTVFEPYTPLGTEEDSQYKRLKYREQTDYLKLLVRIHGIVSAEYIDRFRKSYNKNINIISKKNQKFIVMTLGTVALAAIAAAAAAIAAGPLAVAILGSQFPGLAGAALINSCLAMLGGGAIAIGGYGVAGGIATIAGGGALLGLAGGSAASGALALISSTPEVALTQAAKLEVIMKEILLNSQHDILQTQEILKQYKASILLLNNKLEEMKLEDIKNKEAIKTLTKSLDYLRVAYADMNKYSSAFEVGMDADEE